MGYFLKPVNRQLTERISYVYMHTMFSMHGAIYGGYEPFVKFPSGSYSVSCVGRREEAARKQYILSAGDTHDVFRNRPRRWWHRQRTIGYYYSLLRHKAATS